jgi:kinesin family protein 15
MQRRISHIIICFSHKQKSSGAEGERLKEATNINKSLSALGCVVATFIYSCDWLINFFSHFYFCSFFIDIVSSSVMLQFVYEVGFNMYKLVIMNLVNMFNGKSLHVPFRDSKLTFLLQVGGDPF